jgi:hypothetical protein
MNAKTQAGRRSRLAADVLHCHGIGICISVVEQLLIIESVGGKLSGDKVMVRVCFVPFLSYVFFGWGACGGMRSTGQRSILSGLPTYKSG